MANINYNKIEFLKSAAYYKNLPEDKGIEVAFAGRSNAGKSSALNTLTNRKNLAKTSSKPGKTQHINLFRLDKQRILVDLPGYGFSKVNRAEKKRWEAELTRYLGERQCLRGIVLVMDIRHPLTELDQTMVDFARSTGRDLHIILSKSDKLKKGKIAATVLKVKKDLKDDSINITVQAFSSLNGTGLKELKQQLDFWYTEDKPQADSPATD
ncbi:ribosome biogenesis GTP-binding protein YihA/YsxC [Spirochaeta isovalerica]|uniref:Probable GTP-binding protein EngB n=1 Tax=Spirochaeta isovalerica TaxID=150 RepID=A0A841RDK8_9SPIO|nr:ribosome biogenesis GTP-binding protein YihA/YsxC [Spirochaeta isovalerica]MBB6481080.1 GTP-binding protein [Spirochaeta isovalerica]